MPIRLSLVLTQSPPAKAVATGSADAIVGELLGLPGIDLTLVGRLESIDEHSTDRLTLQSITGDIVFLDWQTAEQICTGLLSHGIEGVRWPHPHDLQADTTSGPPGLRRIYAFDLRQFEKAAELRVALQSLHAEKQIKTIALGSLTPQVAQKSTIQSVAKMEKRESPVRTPQSPSRAILSSGQLDALVDELDDFDV